MSEKKFVVVQEAILTQMRSFLMNSELVQNLRRAF